MLHNIARIIGSIAVFGVSMVFMLIVCVCAWDLFVNGKLYYCTDGGTLDFICVGDWVHHPESVKHIVPRSMSEPDEIKAGWSLTLLWVLWSTFLAVSVFLSSFSAFGLWRATSLNKAPSALPPTP